MAVRAHGLEGRGPIGLGIVAAVVLPGSPVIALGPLLLPLELLLVLAAAALAVALAGWLGRRAGVPAADELWRTVLVALLAARLAFVYEYRLLYLASPLEVLDIRDGGWNAPFGVAAAWLWVLYRGRQQPLLRRPLRWGLAAGTAVFIGGSVGLAVHAEQAPPLPALAFKTLDGQSLALQSLQGRPLVINLWATWCGPCVREMPVLQQAQQQRGDVAFVFLNQGEDPAQVRAWLQRQGLQLDNVLADPLRQASASFKQQGYPTTLFFDARGRLVSRHLGALSAATLDDRLRRVAAR